MRMAGAYSPVLGPRGTHAESYYDEGGRGRGDAPPCVARARNAKEECNKGVRFKIALL